ncbi:polyprenyl synthetase family protein [Candidatus Woesearchaeota archaeon]|nr:polyprenyl synthetase family protein [Candidatus Woesearchaeota archaeon]
MFDEYRTSLKRFLESYLKTQATRYQKVNNWSTDTSQKLIPFTTSGKLLRGSFVLFIAQALGNKETKKNLPVAAAVELIHSSLLIHDDIIDRDELRRGSKTIHEQYKTTSPLLHDATHYGIAQAICVGDLGFVFATDLIVKSTQAAKLMTLFSQEISNTIFAQMEDVHFTLSPKWPTPLAIEKMYLYKTARYTFSLPFKAGAILAQANPTTQKRLEKLGETLGLLFQLKDDELGLLGDEKKTGKPVGSDIREGKKTIHMHLLLKNTTKTETRQILSIIGNKHCSTQDIIYIQTLIKQKGIDQLLQKRMQTLAKNALAQIKQLPFQTKDKEQLISLTNYLLIRES